jgi:hypothetical protein
MDARQSRARRSFSRFDGFAGPPEIVPGEALHVGANDQIRVALPGIQLMLLRGADRASDDLKDVFWSIAAGVLRADRDRNDEAGAKLTNGLSRNRRYQATIRQPACAYLYRLKETRICTAGADGFDERSLPENDWITTGQVRCHDGERNSHVLELFGVEDPFNDVCEAMVAG